MNLRTRWVSGQLVPDSRRQALRELVLGKGAVFVEKKAKHQDVKEEVGPKAIPNGQNAGRRTVLYLVRKVGR